MGIVPRDAQEVSLGYRGILRETARAALIHEFREHRARIEAQRFGEIDELDDINPALTDFDAGNDGL
jgi:hypothetical protein